MTLPDPTRPAYGDVPAQHVPAAATGWAPAPYGPVGQVRGTGLAVLLFFVTFGIYGLYWYYVTHEEMKKHTGNGLGGGLALLLALLVGVASPFIVSSEVGGLYERRGLARPVSGATGLWYVPGILLLVLPFVWFVKTNGALNAYWRSLGARG